MLRKTEHTSCDVKEDWDTLLVMIGRTGQTSCIGGLEDTSSDVKEDLGNFLVMLRRTGAHFL
jgi:hypothetical protein